MHPLQVRFDAPASGMASMPFANEEVSTCVEHQPGTRYIIDTTVFTNAIYGDKFSPMMRCTLEATSKSSCSVHVIYAVWFSKNMSRLVKPVAQKGIEGEAAPAERCTHCRTVPAYRQAPCATIF